MSETEIETRPGVREVLDQVQVEITYPPEFERFPAGEASDYVRKVFEAEMMRIFGEGQF